MYVYIYIAAIFAFKYILFIFIYKCIDSMLKTFVSGAVVSRKKQMVTFTT